MHVNDKPNYRHACTLFAYILFRFCVLFAIHSFIYCDLSKQKHESNLYVKQQMSEVKRFNASNRIFSKFNHYISFTYTYARTANAFTKFDGVEFSCVRRSDWSTTRKKRTKKEEEEEVEKEWKRKQIHKKKNMHSAHTEKLYLTLPTLKQNKTIASSLGRALTRTKCVFNFSQTIFVLSYKWNTYDLYWCLLLALWCVSLSWSSSAASFIKCAHHLHTHKHTTHAC